MLKKKSDKSSFVFIVFSLWTFVLLCRPQDLFPVLAPLRPALATSVLTLVVFLASYKYSPGPFLLQNSHIKKYLLLYAVMIAGIPFSLYARISFEIVITEYIVAVLFVCIFFKLVSSIQRLNKVLLISCLGSGFYFLYALLEFSPGSGRLAFGDMFDPNDLAFFVLGFLPLNLLFLTKENPLLVRFACFGFLLSGLLLILFTGSRGGFIGLCVVVFVLLFFTAKTLNRTFKTCIVIACVLVFSVTAVDTERYRSIFSLEQDYNVVDETGRLAIWKIGLRAMLANPLTGVGVGCFSNAVGLDREARGAETVRWQTAHNSVVQIGTETGVIGLTLFLLLSKNVLLVFRKVKTAKVSEPLVKIAQMGLVGFAGMFTAALFLSQAYSLYWAFYVALSAVASQLLAREQQLAGEGH